MVLLAMMGGLWIAPPAAAQEQPPRPALHILAIGVNEYPGHLSLSGAVPDAELLPDRLAAHGAAVYDSINTMRLLDSDASRESVNAAIRDMVAVAEPEDLFVFFFAGIAYPLREGDKEEFFLFMPDVEADSAGKWDEASMRETGITPRLLKTWLNVIPARNQLVIIDAPYGAEFFEELRRLQAADAAVGGISEGNLAVVTVSEVTVEVPIAEAGGRMHGILTYALVRALEDAPRAAGVLTAAGVGEWIASAALLDALETSGLSDLRFRPRFFIYGADFPLAALPDPASQVVVEAMLRPAQTDCVVLDDGTCASGKIWIHPPERTVTVRGRVRGDHDKFGEDDLPWLAVPALVQVNGRPAELTGNGEFRVHLPLSAVGDGVRVRLILSDGRVEESMVPVSLMRGLDVEEEESATLPPRAGRDIALLFATNQYDHWSDLRNPIYDAQELAFELEQSYGFEVHLIRDPTRQVIMDTVAHYATRADGVEDRLLVFFAGHGAYDRRHIQDGFLVARDTRLASEDQYRDTAVQFNWLRRVLAGATARHVLLILDACYGGSFDSRITESATRSDDDDPLYRSVSRNVYVSRKLELTTRLYLTSGGLERVPDGRPGENSPFTRRLLEALRSYGGEDGLLTLAEIRSVVQMVDPEPRAGEFERNQPGSDFFLIATPSTSAVGAR